MIVAILNFHQKYEVRIAINSEQAIEMAIADEPHIIITHISLAEKHKLEQVLRFEKGMENIFFLLFE